MHAVVTVPRELGESESRLAIVSCPQCSYMSDGECVVCLDGEHHPACEGCADGQLVWYRRPFFVSLGTAIVVSVLAGVIIHKVEKNLRRFM